MIEGPRLGGSVMVWFAAQVLDGEGGFDTIEVFSGLGHVDTKNGEVPAVFEPPVFRDDPNDLQKGWSAAGWYDPGGETLTYGIETGPLVMAGEALSFDLFMVGDNTYQPFAFDLYAYNSQTGVPDFTSHVSYDGNSWLGLDIEEPAHVPFAALGGPVPEPGALIIWSLLGGLAVTLGWPRCHWALQNQPPGGASKPASCVYAFVTDRSLV